MSQRNLVILLFVSLALNLFILGAAAGAYVFGDRMHHRHPEFHGGNPMMMAGSVLPDNEAQAYRDAVSAQVMAERQKVRALVQGVRRLVRPLSEAAALVIGEHPGRIETARRAELADRALEALVDGVVGQPDERRDLLRPQARQGEAQAFALARRQLLDGFVTHCHQDSACVARYKAERKRRRQARRPDGADAEPYPAP